MEALSAIVERYSGRMPTMGLTYYQVSCSFFVTFSRSYSGIRLWSCLSYVVR